MTAIVVHQDEPTAASAAIVAPVEGAGERLSSVAPVPPPSVRRASSRSANRKPKDPHANRPENTRWAQQKLPMWEPMLTLSWTIGICFFVAATCLALGIAIVLTSSDLTTVRVVYDGGSDTNVTDRGDAVAQQKHSEVANLSNCLLDTREMANSFHANHTCFVTITLPEAISGAAHVYYELTGFHQHHRRFVSSVDRTQFTDEWREGIPTTMCAPLEKLESELCDVSVCDPASKRERKAFPCGIVANTMFNDIFWLHDGVLPNSSDTLGPTDLVSKGVARTYPSHNAKNPTWAVSLTEYLPVWHNPNFSRIIAPVSGDRTPHLTSDYTNSTAWVHDPLDQRFGVGTGVENEHWRVWVDGAATQPFRKAYGRIERDLPAGTKLVFAVQSNFFVRSFGGSKALVVSELSWVGSENLALGVFYLAVGGIFGVAGVLFAVRKCTNPRPLGDTAYLEWKHRANATKKAQ
ncbi:hypothetical protein PybrP1_004035 [[Pythium] brassicae (nom. inval.)]|nr:hypothetical protein PybrP1_004035 [[Pythium] brassicae (nom. inval.)]